MTRSYATIRSIATTALTVGCAFLISAPAGEARAADAYPSGTIEMIVPFGAGGGTDTIARIFESEFSKALGANIVIRNIAGASGSVGAAAAAKARPDGYTLGYLPIGPASIQPLLHPGLYGAKSWDYICRTANDPVVLMVPATSKINSVSELLKHTPVIYGSAGVGSVPHLAMAALVASAGIKATHIPYKGTAKAMNAMAGGEIEAFADVPSVVRSFDVKPIGVFGKERLPNFPNVPTLAEAGYPLEFSVWHGVFAPAGTKRAIVSKLIAACRTAVNSPEFVGRLQKVGTTPAFLGGGDFEAFYRNALKTNEKVLRSAGMIN